MKLSLIPLTIISLSACSTNNQKTKLTTFDTFVFSYRQLYTDYSIKFTNSDTIFLQKRFPRPKALFYSIIQNNDVLKLDSFLTTSSFKKYDTLYVQNNLEDGSSYKFVLTKNMTTNWIFIYGKEGPKTLYEFGNWLSDFKERQIFYPIDAKIDFGNLNYILLPEIPSQPDIKNSKAQRY